MPANCKRNALGLLTRYFTAGLVAALVAQNLSCRDASERRCLQAITRDAAVGPDIVPDSVVGVRLASQGARCAGYRTDSVIVTGFERDSASLLIQFGPLPNRGGGGPLVRVSRGGAVAVLERYQ